MFYYILLYYILFEEVRLESPLADCDFAETFGAIVVMPQGWLPELPTGWTPRIQQKVIDINTIYIYIYISYTYVYIYIYIYIEVWGL